MKTSKRTRLSRVAAAVGLLLVLSLAAAPSLLATDPAVVKLWDLHIHDKKFRKDIFKVFNKANPDIKVEYTSQISDTYTTMLEAAFRSDSPPDIFESSAGSPMAKLVELGRIRSLDSVAPAKADLEKFKALFPANLNAFVENLNVFEGEIYSWPIKASEGPSYSLLYYNTRLFRDAGLKGSDGQATAPETWADMRLDAKKITELEPGKTYGMIFGGKDPHIWVQNVYYSMAVAAGWPIWGFGFDFRTGRWNYHHPGFRAAIQLWLDMKKDGSVFPGTGSMDDEQAKFKFSQNVAGMMFNGPWTPGGLIAVNPELEFDLVLPPTQVWGERKGVLSLSGTAENSEYVVSSKIKNPEAVWRVITFMTSQQYQEGWVQVGGGISVFPQYNKVEYFPHPSIAKLAAFNAAGVSQLFPGAGQYGGYPSVWFKMEQFFETPRPIHWDILEGQWIGQLGWEAWDDYERRANAAMDKAMEEASKKYGISITQADFTFPDWDPAKPYSTSRPGK